MQHLYIYTLLDVYPMPNAKCPMPFPRMHHLYIYTTLDVYSNA
jgi:hypothetical protein